MKNQVIMIITHQILYFDELFMKVELIFYYIIIRFNFPEKCCHWEFLILITNFPEQFHVILINNF